MHELFCYETLLALINVLTDEDYRNHINNSSDLWELIFRSVFESKSLRLLRVGFECFCNVSLLENVKTFIGLGQNNASIKFMLAFLVIGHGEYEFSDLDQVDNLPREYKYMNEAILGTLANLHEVNQLCMCIMEKREYVEYITARIVGEETPEVQKLVVIFKGLLKNQSKLLEENLSRHKILEIIEDVEDKVKTK